MRRSSLSPLRLGSIIEAPEYECDQPALNLGAESPGSEPPKSAAENDSTSQLAVTDGHKCGFANYTDMPVWKRRGRRIMQDLVDQYCGICFKVAVMPCKTMCCSKLFCLEHISMWVYGPSSSRRCPSCQGSCSFISSPPPSPLASLTDLSHTSTDSVKPTSSIKPDRPVILLVMQDSETSLSFTPKSPHTLGSVLSNTNASAGKSIMRRSTNASDSQCGPCFHSSSGFVVLLGRMMGRVLSIVGLTLFLFVLLA